MVDENNSIFSIRKFNVLDTDAVVNIWKEWISKRLDNTELDIQKTIFSEELFLAGVKIKLTAAMFGYDGHRGWLNYFAVAFVSN